MNEQDLTAEARKAAEEIRRGPYSGCHLSFSDEAALESILLDYAQRVREPLERESALSRVEATKNRLLLDGIIKEHESLRAQLAEAVERAKTAEARVEALNDALVELRDMAETMISIVGKAAIRAISARPEAHTPEPK